MSDTQGTYSLGGGRRGGVSAQGGQGQDGQQGSKQANRKLFRDRGGVAFDMAMQMGYF